jgi:hypothetical protein
MSKFIASSVLIFVLAFGSFSCSDNSVNPIEYSREDYLIYQKALSQQFADKKYLIVLADSTYGNYTDTSSISYYRKNIQELSNNTIMNYISINRTKIKLKHIPDIPNLVFRSEFNVKQKDTVSVTLSRIGYNESKTQAMLTMSEVYGPLAGAGYLVFLKKNGDSWTVAKLLMIWIS